MGLKNKTPSDFSLGVSNFELNSLTSSIVGSTSLKLDFAESTFLVAELGRIRTNPDLVLDGAARRLVKLKEKRFFGKAEV